MARFLEYAAARFVLATLGWTPLWLANVLARLYVRLLDIAAPKLRRTAIRNLELAGFADRERIADGVFRSIARILVALARFPRLNRGNISQWIRYEGFSHYEEAMRRGQGVLFATAHLGNWELSAFAHALLAAPMRIVVRPLDNPRVDALVERLRTLSGNRLITKSNAARAILQALGDNQAVGILIDQNTTLDEGVFVDFFGVPACTGTAFAKLAARSDAAVIPGYALWSEEERRYVLHFETPVEIRGDAAEDTARIQARLEQAIRRHPDQWLWVHRRWKTRPPGEPPLY